MSLFDDAGEWFGGITDTVVEGGERYWSAWIDSEVEKTKEAAPEEQRPTSEPAQQPTGELVNPLPVQPNYGFNTQTALIAGVWGLAVLGVIIAFKD